MSHITRSHEARDLSLTTSVGTTPEIKTGCHAAGTVYIPSGSTITTLTFHTAPTEGGTYLPLYSGAVAVTLTVTAGRAYPLPSGVYGTPFTKIVADAAGAISIALVS